MKEPIDTVDIYNDVTESPLRRAASESDEPPRRKSSKCRSKLRHCKNENRDCKRESNSSKSSKGKYDSFSESESEEEGC